MTKSGTERLIFLSLIFLSFFVLNSFNAFRKFVGTREFFASRADLGRLYYESARIRDPACGYFNELPEPNDLEPQRHRKNSLGWLFRPQPGSEHEFPRINTNSTAPHAES